MKLKVYWAGRSDDATTATRASEIECPMLRRGAMLVLASWDGNVHGVAATPRGFACTHHLKGVGAMWVYEGGKVASIVLEQEFKHGLGEMEQQS